MPCQAYADVVGGPTSKNCSHAQNSGLEFKENMRRDLDVPATLEELKQVGEFFQGR